MQLYSKHLLTDLNPKLMQSTTTDFNYILLFELLFK